MRAGPGARCVRRTLWYWRTSTASCRLPLRSRCSFAPARARGRDQQNCRVRSCREVAVEVQSRNYPSQVSFIIQECGKCVAPFQPVPPVLLVLCRGLATRGCEQDKLQLSTQLLITWAFAVGKGLIDLAVEGVVR